MLNVFVSVNDVIREIYAKRQTSDSSWEFLKIENVQLTNSRLPFVVNVTLNLSVTLQLENVSFGWFEMR